ncbi:LuxR C-terminal-related transcriptional regulator [Plantactinospora sp. CA-294935]|uniref:LuxR C-terminal-related transcriptional regulator n=1 Tax=Plantactinospora sp. CA-294935 TaxID=3240012 RepID=UPI003D8DF008
MTYRASSPGSAWSGRSPSSWACLSRRSAGTLAGNALTAQEREVTEVAAAGRPTNEIAARLMISPRTVSAQCSPSSASAPVRPCGTHSPSLRRSFFRPCRRCRAASR